MFLLVEDVNEEPISLLNYKESVPRSEENCCISLVSVELVLELKQNILHIPSYRFMMAIA